jgi:hypothetical protein
MVGPPRPPPLAPALHPDLEFVAEPDRTLVQRTHRPPATPVVFTSVADLSAAITTWAEHWNTDPKPFIWKATAEDIIAKVQRGRDTLHQIKTQTHHYRGFAPARRVVSWSAWFRGLRSVGVETVTGGPVRCMNRS